MFNRTAITVIISCASSFYGQSYRTNHTRKTSNSMVSGVLPTVRLLLGKFRCVFTHFFSEIVFVCCTNARKICVFRKLEELFYCINEDFYNVCHKMLVGKPR